MVQIKEIEEKTTPAKRSIKLKNISVKDIKLVELDSGEDISKDVIEAIPFDSIDFSISFEIPDVE